MNLTRDNYYTPEADVDYMSCSQYEDFLSCEAMAMAKLQKRHTQKPSKAFVVGNYFHTHFEGKAEHEQFCEENFDNIYKTKTTKARGLEIVGKYADFEQADRMIAAAEADPMIKKLIDMPGENEKIMTGKLFDSYPWKIRVDKFIDSPAMIIDWKTVANIRERMWSEQMHERVSFVRGFNYVMRAAVYCEIAKQFLGRDADPAFLLVCLSKQDPVDKEIISVNHRQSLDIELEYIHENMPRIMAIKNGLRRPKRCGRCEYCRSTKEIRDVVPFYKLDPGEGDGREEEYDAYVTPPRQ